MKKFGSTPQVVKRRKRRLSKDVLARLRTLENSMLYQNFIKKLEKLNPDLEIDEHVIDRTLEPDEALNDIKRRHYELITSDAESSTFELEFRDYLESKGISSKMGQRIALAELKSGTLDEEELMKVGSLIAEIKRMAAPSTV